jgi:hypothetical protein
LTREHLPFPIAVQTRTVPSVFHVVAGPLTSAARRIRPNNGDASPRSSADIQIEAALPPPTLNRSAEFVPDACLKRILFYDVAMTQQRAIFRQFF